MLMLVGFAVGIYLMVTGGFGVLFGVVSMSIGLFPDDDGNWSFNPVAMLGWWAIVIGFYVFVTA